MAIKSIVISSDGTKVECVYPKSSFLTIFSLRDDAYSKWEQHSINIKRYLHNANYEEMCKEIDSAINNIENLDLA